MKGVIFVSVAAAAMTVLAVSPMDKARMQAKLKKAEFERDRQAAAAKFQMQRKVEERKREAVRDQLAVKRDLAKAKFRMEQKKMEMKYDWARRFPHGPADLTGWRRGKTIHRTHRSVWVGDVWYDAYGYPCYSPTYVVPAGVSVVPAATVVTPAAAVVAPAPVVVTPTPVVVPVVR